MESTRAHVGSKEGGQLFGSFHLGDAELALPVAAVQEVVGFPQSITPVPLAPAHLLGLFNLRGRLIPVVQLGRLLRLAERAERDAARVAIVELDGGSVGLLFDATGEILRVHAGEQALFADAGETALIGGVLKLDGGRRMLQLLSTGALSRLPDLPRLPADLCASQTQRLRAAQGQRRQSVSFRLGQSALALPMGAVHEIIRVPELLGSVLASELCLGVLDLRGDTVPVVDFAHFLGVAKGRAWEGETGSFDDPRRILILRQGGTHVGLLVDEVESIVSYRDDELLAVPSFQSRQAPLFAGCIHTPGGKNILLLSEAALAADAMLIELTAGHRALYRADDDARLERGKRRAGARETYVTFRLDRLMGMRIEQLREVIEYPADVIHPPGAPAYVRGILNLRRRLVTIVDLRSLYGMAACAGIDQAKVLIVEHEGEPFGLVADAIENIVTIDANDKLRVPACCASRSTAPCARTCARWWNCRTGARSCCWMPSR